MKKEELENYEHKGELEGFPKEIIARMLDCQQEQGNPRNVRVFERNEYIAEEQGGFDWDETKEKGIFWEEVIINKNFNLFFERYPKQNNSQDFRVDDLESYTPKGGVEGFPKEIIARMLDYQEEQGNARDISIFEKDRTAGEFAKGVSWSRTKEGLEFWYKVIRFKNFDVFFERYPKKDNQDNSQEFKVGDLVVDIVTGRKGKIHQINTDCNIVFPIHVNFDEAESYTLDGKYYEDDKYPRLLHYRDDYDYSIIDFNNLPKRQDHKRWRAEKDGVYNFVSFSNECWFFSDDTKDEYDHFDNDNYNSGNYFCTEVEAEIIAQKLNTYMRQLIEEEHEHKRV